MFIKFAKQSGSLDYVGWLRWNCSRVERRGDSACSFMPLCASKLLDIAIMSATISLLIGEVFTFRLDTLKAPTNVISKFALID